MEDRERRESEGWRLVRRARVRGALFWEACSSCAWLGAGGIGANGGVPVSGMCAVALGPGRAGCRTRLRSGMALTGQSLRTRRTTHCGLHTRTTCDAATEGNTTGWRGEGGGRSHMNREKERADSNAHCRRRAR